MKNLVVAICVIAFLGGAITRCNTIRDEKQVDKVELTNQISALSERVDLVAYVPSEELWDGEMDDESPIIYTDNMSEDFEVEEFTEYDPNPSEATVNKIRSMHIPELQKVRDNMNMPIVIRSASRSAEHEKKEVGQVTRSIYTLMD